MGEVFIRYSIKPDSPEVDMEGLQATVQGALPGCATVQSFDIKPFAFGLKVLNVAMVVEDEEGNNDLVEEALNGLDNVQGVELVEMGRL